MFPEFSAGKMRERFGILDDAFRVEGNLRGQLCSNGSGDDDHQQHQHHPQHDFSFPFPAAFQPLGSDPSATTSLQNKRGDQNFSPGALLHYRRIFPYWVDQFYAKESITDARS